MRLTCTPACRPYQVLGTSTRESLRNPWTTDASTQDGPQPWGRLRLLYRTHSSAEERSAAAKRALHGKFRKWPRGAPGARRVDIVVPKEEGNKCREARRKGLVVGRGRVFQGEAGPVKEKSLLVCIRRGEKQVAPHVHSRGVRAHDRRTSSV